MWTALSPPAPTSAGSRTGTVMVVSTVRTGTSTVSAVFGVSRVISLLLTDGTSTLGMSIFGGSGMSILPAASSLPRSSLLRSTDFIKSAMAGVAIFAPAVPTLISAEVGSATSMILAAVRIAAAAVLALVRTGAVAAPTGMMIEAILKVASPAAAAGSSFHLSQAIRPLPALTTVIWQSRRKLPAGPGIVATRGIVSGLVTASPTASLPRLLHAAP